MKSVVMYHYGFDRNAAHERASFYVGDSPGGDFMLEAIQTEGAWSNTILAVEAGADPATPNAIGGGVTIATGDLAGGRAVKTGLAIGQNQFVVVRISAVEGSAASCYLRLTKTVPPEG